MTPVGRALAYALPAQTGPGFMSVGPDGDPVRT